MKRKKIVPIILLDTKIGVAIIDNHHLDILNHKKIKFDIECDSKKLTIRIKEYGKTKEVQTRNKKRYI